MTMVVGDDGNSIGTFKILSVVGIRVQEPSRFYAPFVYRLGPRPFTAVRGVRFSYGVPVYFLGESTMDSDKSINKTKEL